MQHADAPVDTSVYPNVDTGCTCTCQSLPLRVLAHLARHDLGTLDGQHLAIVELEVGILDNKCPHLIAEAVVMQMALVSRDAP